MLPAGGRARDVDNCIPLALLGFLEAADIHAIELDGADRLVDSQNPSPVVFLSSAWSLLAYLLLLAPFS